MKFALVIIDMQEDFFKDNLALNEKRCRLSSNINYLIDICRTSDVPIIWVTQEFEKDLRDAFMFMRENNIYKNIRETEGCAILSELRKDSNDPHIVKKRYSAFYNTDLEETLKANNIDTLILAGINTHACIRMAAVDAYQRDYKVILAKDCIDSYDKAFHEESIRYLTRYISKAFDNNDIKKTLTENK